MTGLTGLNVFNIFLVWLCHYLTDNKVVTERIGDISVLTAKYYSFNKLKCFLKLKFTAQILLS